MPFSKKGLYTGKKDRGRKTDASVLWGWKRENNSSNWVGSPCGRFREKSFICTVYEK